MSAPIDILLVEDDPAQRTLLAEVLGDAGFAVACAAGVAAALPLIATPSLQLVLSDFKLADGDGLVLLRELRQRRPELSFVLLTAYGSIEHAVSALRAGADDYLAKPFERQALLLAVDKALRTLALL